MTSVAPGFAADDPARSEESLAVATFAGGCFWCMEKPFDGLDGVKSTIVGYTGGSKANPSYEQVSAGGTGHAEVVQITYDPARISYQELLQVFWRNIDPTTPARQFCDRGTQYRSAIFFLDDSQFEAARRSVEELERNKPFPEAIVTEVVPAGKFYEAEEYHQDYYVKNPIRYKYYRHGCGRDKRLKDLWGDAE
jgi:peptide-methionine (S)-S-oxide reductase